MLIIVVFFSPTDRPELSNWTTHWVSFLILMLLGCSNTILVRGVYIDAEEPEGQCVDFPCQYLRVSIQKERLKRLNNKTEEENSKSFNKNEKSLDTFVNISIIHTPPIENSTNYC